MQRERKAFPVSHCKALDEAQGIIEAIVSVFGVVDYAKERVLPGAFAESLGKKLPKGVWAHDWTCPVAKTLEAKELLPGDPMLPESIRQYGGLYIKGQFNLETQRGREAFSDLQFGTIDEFSFGYEVKQRCRDAKTGVTDLQQLDIFEWSPVLVGCNPVTELISAKEAPVESQTKGQYLGPYAEGEATIAALRDLSDSLFYYVLYDCCFDGEDPIDERLAMAEGALNEYRDLALSVMQAILSGESEQSMEEAGAEMKRLWTEPKTKATPDNPPAGKSFATQLDSALAAVEAVVARTEDLAKLRAQDGRTLSAEKRAQVTDLKARVEALETLCAPPADAKALQEVLTRHIGRKVMLRALLTP